MWMNCPASITKAAGRTRPSSRYAKEGTAAHTIAEMIIGGNLFPPPKITVEGDEFIVGIPMLRALNPYIDLVQRFQALTKDVHIEARVGLRWGSGLVWGTTDCAARSGKDLYIADLKFGRGVAVLPDTPQLKIYALAAIDTFWPGKSFDTVHLTVVQPRLNPVPQTHLMLFDELREWHVRRLIPAMSDIVLGREEEVVGSWCRWCVRRQECDAYAGHKSAAAAVVFDDGVDILNT